MRSPEQTENPRFASRTDVAERHRHETHRGELEERRQIDRRDATVVEDEDRRRRNRDRVEAGVKESVDDEAVEFPHVGLNASRCGALRGLEPPASSRYFLARMCPYEPAPCTMRSG